MPIVTISIALGAHSAEKQGSHQTTLTFAPRLNAKNFKLGPVQTPMGPLAGRVTGSIS